jgi:hypothetical protein
VEGRAHRAARSPEMEETALLCPGGAGDDVSEVPDGGGCVDGARLSTMSSRAWSALSGTSSSRAERWPEGGASAGALRSRCQARLAARFEELKSSDGAPEQGKGGETREGTRLTGSGPKSTVHSGSPARNQGSLAAAWAGKGEG